MFRMRMVGPMLSARLHEIAQLFAESYNRLNGLNNDTCDPQKRQVTYFSAKLAEFIEHATTIELYMAGRICQTNCNSMTNLFDPSNSSVGTVLESSEQVACVCSDSDNVNT
jgi:hypothetical protein